MCVFIVLYSVTQTCSLTPTVTFGQIGEEINTGFLQQVNYDELDWLLDNSTLTGGTGPGQDNTEGDTDGRFAYMDGFCGPQYDSHEACEGERVYNIHYGIVSIVLAQAIFETPCFPSGPGCVLSFTYHLYNSYFDDDPTSDYYYLFDMGILEIEVWHGGKWNMVFHEGGRDYGDIWNNASVDLSVSSQNLKTVKL